MTGTRPSVNGRITNTKKTEVMFHNQLIGQQITIGTEALVRAEEYTYLAEHLVYTQPAKKTPERD